MRERDEMNQDQDSQSCLVDTNLVTLRCTMLYSEGGYFLPQ